jgi:fructokinase
LAQLHTDGCLTKSGLAQIDEAAIALALGFATKVAAVTVSRAGANPPLLAELQA